MIKSMIAVGLVAMAFASNVFASPKPSACPSVAAVAKEGFAFTLQDDDEYQAYLVAQINNYNLPEQWTFVMTVPLTQATGMEDASNKASIALKSLKGTPKPQQHQQKWYCSYENDYHYFAVAFIPADVGASMYGQAKGPVEKSAQ